MDLHLFNKVVDKYIAGTATENERKLVEAYWERLSTEGRLQLNDAEKEAIRLKIQAAVKEGIKSPVTKIERTEFIKADQPERSTSLYRTIYFKRIAAAAIILIIAGIAYFTLFNSGKLTPEPQTIAFKNDIQPANQTATLTLADGRIIKLDSSNNGSISNENGVKITKHDGQLTYENESPLSPFEKGGLSDPNINKDSRGISGYNTLSTARGRSYHVKLSDGTTVWLDAMSSIKYPAAFTGNNRTVEITGQAYFDVAKNTQKPFIVRSAQQTIEVLGTEFNINTYSNPVTTLITGSIKLSAGNNSVILKPKEQSNGSATTQNINIEKITAWKNNQFRFDGNTIKEIMTEISRWYDIEVEYRSDISEEFVAKISRDVPLSKLLGLLSMTGQVKFTIEGKKITVIKP